MESKIDMDTILEDTVNVSYSLTELGFGLRKAFSVTDAGLTSCLRLYYSKEDFPTAGEACKDFEKYL